MQAAERRNIFLTTSNLKSGLKHTVDQFSLKSIKIVITVDLQEVYELHHVLIRVSEVNKTSSII